MTAVLLKANSRAKASLVDAANARNQTALMVAAERDDAHRCVSMLAHARADLDLRDAAGETALMKAARLGSVHTVRLLLSMGARADLKDASSFTALLHAAYEGHRVTALILLARHPRISVADVVEELGVRCVACTHARTQRGAASHSSRALDGRALALWRVW